MSSQEWQDLIFLLLLNFVGVVLVGWFQGWIVVIPAWSMH